MGRIGANELLLLLLIVMLLFGAARLPRLARSLREARDEFQKGNAEGEKKGNTDGEKPAEASSEKSPDAT